MPPSRSYVIILEFYLIVKLSSLVCYVVHIGKGHFKDKSVLFDLRCSYYFVIIIIIIIIIILPYTKSALKTVLQFFNFLRKITPIVYSVDFLLCWFLSVVLLLDRIICQRNKESDTNTLILIWPVCLLSNEIAGFFDHHYLWKESSDFKISIWSLSFR